MSTERLVKWSKESQEFFEKAKDNSIVLDIIISVGASSQTNYGFEDLVNSINDEASKVKKVNIIDTTYLYRHCEREFSSYKNSPTLWYINNKSYINDLKVDVNYKRWDDEINNDTFKAWHKQIMLDYEGADKKFRDLVIADASVAAYKGKYKFEKCCYFILEECAHMCAFLKNSVVPYPMKFYSSVNYIIEKYNINLMHLFYKISTYAKSKNDSFKDLRIERDVFPFLMETLDINFFILDRFGNYIYKNNKLATITTDDISANLIDPKAWKISMNIMQTGERKILEEEFNGKYYLSIKEPLLIKGEIEGVMGSMTLSIASLIVLIKGEIEGVMG
jgi:hypothetical protein